MNRRMFFYVLLVVCVCGGFIGLRAGAESGASSRAGEFSVLTYNVAGLPELISGSHPSVYTELISPKLNDFDLVLVQEDFSYNDELSSRTEHAHSSPPGTAGTVGDGLARFSRFPIQGKVDHVSWEECHGYFGHANDCLTKKGFSIGVHELRPGTPVHVYNLHMDAGGSERDQETRSVQMDQLIRYMKKHSKGMPVIIAGDFNLAEERPRDLKTLQRLIDKQVLKDACRQMNCGRERIDRILFRGNDSLRFKAVRYQVEEERFTNDKGKQLSDHEAVSAVLEWKVVE
ncbi:MAG: endonuclease/exonuclease/phosphatase family protein [bacterium]